MRTLFLTSLLLVVLLSACSQEATKARLHLDADPDVGPIDRLAVQVRAGVGDDAQVAKPQVRSLSGRDLAAEPFEVDFTLPDGSAFATEVNVVVLAYKTGEAAPFASALATLDLAGTAVVGVTLALFDDGCDADGDGFKACEVKPECCTAAEKEDAADCDDALVSANPFAETKACRICSAECGAVEGDADHEVVGPQDVKDVDDVPDRGEPLFESDEVAEAVDGLDVSKEIADEVVPEIVDVVTDDGAGDMPDACEPDCAGAECGDDGCGGSCGQCATGKACVTGACICPDECSEVGKKECADETHFRTCGDPDSDTCLEWSTGACSGGDTCHDEGICDCTPSCAGKVCGDNGCGGSCGGCSNGKTCSVGQCVCAGSTDDDCDGVDDDCNGQKDEDFVPDATCGVGYCKTHNTPSSCAAGLVTPCAAGAKLSTTDVTCDAVDDDCSGQTDEDYVSVTTCFKPGACAAGNVGSSCAAGVVTACKTGTPSANDATCDAVDDDCDGSTDENATCDDGVASTSDSCEAGVCKNVPSVTAGFVKIPAGSFWMGSPGGEACPSGYTGGGCPGSGTAASELGRGSVEVLHYVKLTTAFELQAKELTQGEWKAVYPAWNPSNFTACGDTCPVEQVSWYDVLAYANAKSVGAGLTPCYVLAGIACQDGTNVAAPADCIPSTRGGINVATVTLNGVASPYLCTGFRLPTESEWEYAYRAGGTTAFHTSAGNNGAITQTSNEPLDPNLNQIAWYGGNSTATYAGAYNCSGWFSGSTTCGPQQGGGKEANAWGLYDMAGNVWEWCWDGYATYPAGTVASPAQDPPGGSGSTRVMRGGSWSFVANYARAADRDYYGPGDRYYDLGARLARSVP